MIYWYYKDDKEADKLAARMEKAEKEAENQNCDPIGENLTDIAAIILAGYTFAEVTAYIAEATGATISEITSGLKAKLTSGPFMIPQKALDIWMDNLNYRLHGDLPIA